MEVPEPMARVMDARWAMERATAEYRKALEAAVAELKERATRDIADTLANEKLPLEARHQYAANMVQVYLGTAFDLGKQYYRHSL